MAHKQQRRLAAGFAAASAALLTLLAGPGTAAQPQPSLIAEAATTEGTEEPSTPNAAPEYGIMETTHEDGSVTITRWDAQTGVPHITNYFAHEVESLSPFEFARNDFTATGHERAKSFGREGYYLAAVFSTSLRKANEHAKN